MGGGGGGGGGGSVNLEDFALLRTCALQPVNCMAHLCSHSDHPGHSLSIISF